MKLSSEEQAWLGAYRQALAEQFPDLVEEIGWLSVLPGSHA